MENFSLKSKYPNLLKADWIDTPIGQMLAIADDESLYLLEFLNRRAIIKGLEELCKKTKSVIVEGQTAPLESIRQELKKYFLGRLKQFQTPIRMIGSPFRLSVWQELTKISIGRTCSYSNLAKAVGNPLAVRAIGGANGANRLALIIPCHRVIQANGQIGGYAAGQDRKKWLLEHERQYGKE